MVVDGDGVRARIVEAIIDRLCETVDADIDAMATTIFEAGVEPRPSLAVCNASMEVGLSQVSMDVPAVRLSPSALLAASRWDLVVCTDLAVFEHVRSLARAANALERTGGRASIDACPDEEHLLRWQSHPSGKGADASVLCITDFLASAVPACRGDRLPEELRRIACPWAEIGDTSPVTSQIDGSLVDLPGLPPSFAREYDGGRMVSGEAAEAFDDLCGAAAICCCGRRRQMEGTLTPPRLSK